MGDEPPLPPLPLVLPPEPPEFPPVSDLFPPVPAAVVAPLEQAPNTRNKPPRTTTLRVVGTQRLNCPIGILPVWVCCYALAGAVLLALWFHM